MQTFYLDVKQRFGIYQNAGLFEKQFGKTLFVGALYRSQLFKHSLIVGKFLEIRQLFGMFAVRRPDTFVKQSCKRRIGVAEPASVGDAVCDIGKHEAPEAESGDDEADSCEEETTEETAGAAEETPSAADREVSPQEESEVTAE